MVKRAPLNSTLLYFHFGVQIISFHVEFTRILPPDEIKAKLRQHLHQTDEKLPKREVHPVPTIDIAEDTTIHERIEKGVTWKNFDVEKFINKGKWHEGEDKYKANSFNQEASDAIAPIRKIPDSREAPCRSVDYSSVEMSPTSVIITYHNEARSSLLRTVFSVFNMSPEALLTEIVLVDDNSEDVNIGRELAQIEKIRVLRNNQREGLIRSRVKGAQVAKAPVLTFLDSHIECNIQWLEPLLARIAENPKAVVAPIIDVINVDNFNYVGASADLRGGHGLGFRACTPRGLPYFLLQKSLKNQSIFLKFLCDIRI
uniref:Glyco_trans_2-like domain-containing protein n=1 Tax=Caenorhabditis japonica TaxID=281687 RepID=A0A8R1I4F9_CAEJA